jgi:hypothetical protein
MMPCRTVKKIRKYATDLSSNIFGVGERRETTHYCCICLIDNTDEKLKKATQGSISLKITAKCLCEEGR